MGAATASTVQQSSPASMVVVRPTTLLECVPVGELRTLSANVNAGLHVGMYRKHSTELRTLMCYGA